MCRRSYGTPSWRLRHVDRGVVVTQTAERRGQAAAGAGAALAPVTGFTFSVEHERAVTLLTREKSLAYRGGVVGVRQRLGRVRRERVARDELAVGQQIENR